MRSARPYQDENEEERIAGEGHCLPVFASVCQSMSAFVDACRWRPPGHLVHLILTKETCFVRNRRSVSLPSEGQLGVEPSGSTTNPKHNRKRWWLKLWFSCIAFANVSQYAVFRHLATFSSDSWCFTAFDKL